LFGGSCFLGNEAKTFGKRSLSKFSDLKGSMCRPDSSTIHLQTSEATDARGDKKFLRVLKCTMTGLITLAWPVPHG